MRALFHKDRAAGRHSRFWTIVVGAGAGILLWLVLPAAGTLTHALRAAGVGDGWDTAIVIATFVIGGIEGASLLMPVLLARSGRGGEGRR